MVEGGEDGHLRLAFVEEVAEKSLVFGGDARGGHEVRRPRFLRVEGLDVGRPEEQAAARRAVEVADVADSPVVFPVGSVEFDADPRTRGELRLPDELHGPGLRPLDADAIAHGEPAIDVFFFLFFLFFVFFGFLFFF